MPRQKFPRTVAITDATHAKLTAEADARDLSPALLADRLLSAALDRVRSVADELGRVETIVNPAAIIHDDPVRPSIPQPPKVAAPK